MNKQEAIARLDALDAEAKALRAIIEAEPKKEPRGLCWVWDGWEGNNRRRVAIVLGGHVGHYTTTSVGWDNAIPLTDSELQEYRGRWE